jgi:hypothetical protein
MAGNFMSPTALVPNDVSFDPTLSRLTSTSILAVRLRAASASFRSAVIVFASAVISAMRRFDSMACSSA